MVDPFRLYGGSGNPHELQDGITDSEFFDFLERLAVFDDHALSTRGFICRDGSQLSPVGLAAFNHKTFAKVASKMTSLRIAQLTSLTPQSLQPWASTAEQLRVLEFPEGVDLDPSYVSSLSRFPTLEAIAFDDFDMQACSVSELITALRSIGRLRELALPHCMLDADEIRSLINHCVLSGLVVSSQRVSDDEQKAICEDYRFCQIRWE
jgi:hypothetical protein